MATLRKEGDLAAQMLRLVERATPATPPAGHAFFYAKTDGRLYSKDDSGIETAAGDSWTTLKAAADVSNSALTAVDVTGLGFTPVANTLYLVDAYLVTTAAAATTGVQLALAGPITGITYAAVTIRQPTAAATEVLAHTGLNTFLAATAGLTTPAISRITALISVGASPGAGQIRPQLRSEIALSAVTVKAGSVLMYRTL